MFITRKTIMSYNNFNALTNDIIELAKAIMPNKAIYINFLDNQVQVTMKVSNADTLVRVNEGETIPVLNALCNQIDYDSGKPLILSNAKDNNFDEKVKKTIENSNLGSYLGIPLRFKNGQRFGALCAAHHDESEFDLKDIQLLEKIANLFSYYLELESIAYKDPLTDIFNTQYLLVHQDEMLTNGGLAILLDLDCFKSINDTLGHQVGDLVLKELGSKLKEFSSNFQESHVIRFGGDEFFIYIKDKLTEKQIKQYLKSLIKRLSVWETDIKDLELTSSIGALVYEGEMFETFTALFNITDKLLYEAKNNGRNAFVLK